MKIKLNKETMEGKNNFLKMIKRKWKTFKVVETETQIKDLLDKNKHKSQKFLICSIFFPFQNWNALDFQDSGTYIQIGIGVLLLRVWYQHNLFKCQDYWWFSQDFCRTNRKRAAFATFKANYYFQIKKYFIV